MGALAPSQAAGVRRAWIRENPARARVQRPQLISNGAGGTKPAFRDVEGLTEVPCRILPPKGVYNVSEGRQVTTHDARIALCMVEMDPADMNVKPGDVLTVGANRWRVVGTDSGRADAICLVCEVNREAGQPVR